MHLLVREHRGLDEGTAEDLGHAPADVVLLSFSDSDLSAAAAAWSAMVDRPSLRLANLTRLRHPMSVDLYAEQVLARSGCVVVRLLGGVEYFAYGAEEFAQTCRRHGVPVAFVPGCTRRDDRLAELSSVPPAAWARLDALLREGGPENGATAIRLAWHLAGRGPDDRAGVVAVPACGEHVFGEDDDAPDIALVFYRSHRQAGDIAPLEALAAALARRGLRTRGLFVGSLKDAAAAAFVAGRLAAWRPAVVLNATGFSARGEAGSPLEAGVPVLQLVLAASGRDDWAASTRGLGQSDLAMQVVLPELDGRLLAGVVGFKAELPPARGLDFARRAFAPDADLVELVAARAAGWARLGRTPAGARRVAIILSDYPGVGTETGQVGHAVGLDGFASLRRILALLAAAGYAVGEVPDGPALIEALTAAPATPLLDAAEHARLTELLPAELRMAVGACWGAPGEVRLRCLNLGHLLVAVQPDRGAMSDRRAGYHDAATPPCPAYVGFYLWLRHVFAADAVVHLGAHGTLEWLPGKAVALSAACAPAALLGGLPVIYPFIVNNPGEAAAAKRRLGAVTIGHLTPPLVEAGLTGEARAVEALLDEYAAADGLDRRRCALLAPEILARAAAAGLLEESGAGDDEAEQLVRLDAHLCDVKGLRIRDGLHVFGESPEPARRAALIAALNGHAAAIDRSAPAEAAALLAALDGRFVEPGPAGAPSGGRTDVLPTGRNLAAIDPRAVPTQSAWRLAQRLAEALLARHRQEQGEWLRTLVVDCWGSATMRTGGEALALALILLGAAPVWDAASGRVSGVEVVPLALLDRPRVDVTLRVSGLFRDAFPAQMALFDEAVRAVAGRDEAAEWNSLAAGVAGLSGAAWRQATARIFGAAPGCYGAGTEAALAAEAGLAAVGQAAVGQAAVGQAWLDGAAAAYGQGLDGVAAPAALAALVAAAEAHVQIEDHAEADLLDGPDLAAHEGGFAAAAALLGAAPALYHPDTSRPEAPVVRDLAQALTRVARGKLGNPRWVAGQLRHGYAGAAAVARGVDALAAYAVAVPFRLDRLFDAVWEATLGDPAVEAALRAANPAAAAAIRARLAAALEAGRWRPRRNAVGLELAGAG